VVTVTAKDAEGKKASGRLSITIPNVHYISRLMGNPSIPVINDRFAKKEKNEYRIAARIKNIFKEDVALDTAKVTYNRCGGKSLIDYFEINSSSLIKKSDISGNDFTDEVIALDTAVVPKEACSVGIIFTGKMENNLPVTARLSFDLPITSKEEFIARGGIVVKDPKMINQLNRAAKIAGNNVPVTSALIHELKNEGKL